MNAPAQIPPGAPPTGPFAGPGAAPGPSRPGRGPTILLLVLGVAGTGLSAHSLWDATPFSSLRSGDMMQAAAIGGAGLLLLGLGVQRLLRGLRGWIAAGAIVVVPAALATVVTIRATAAAEATAAAYAVGEAMFRRFEPVCTGMKAIPEAAAYDRAPGAHPTVFFTTVSTGATYDWVPDTAGGASWTPAPVEQTQLVVCITTEKQLVGGCSYETAEGNRYLNRVRYVGTIVLYEAKTRAVVAQGRIDGSEPDPCPETPTFSEAGISEDLAGTLPSDDKLVEIVRPWIDVGPQGTPSATQAVGGRR
jgi:hypothetical protein